MPREIDFSHTMRPLVLYHASCADGFAAALAAWMRLGDRADYCAVKYGEVEAPVNLIGMFGDSFAERVVYIVDFSFPKEVMKWLIDNCKLVVWLDHHKTAFEAWDKDVNTPYYHADPKCEIVLDNRYSGAMLAYHHFFGEDVPPLFRLIDDYDRWQFKLEGTKEFNKAAWSEMPWSFPQWAVWATDPNVLVEMIGKGATLLKAHDGNVKAVVKGAMMECCIRSSVPIDGAEYEPGPNPSLDQWLVRGKAANCPTHLTSDVGHQLAKESGTFGLVWTLKRDGKVACSLRSEGDYDVSAIAKVFGGGGHKNAAGFEAPSVKDLWTWLIPSSQ